MNVYRQGVIDEKTCSECKRLHDSGFSPNMPLGAVNCYLLSHHLAATITAVVAALYLDLAEKEKTMPDPNAPNKPDDTIPSVPEEADLAMAEMTPEERERLFKLHQAAQYEKTSGASEATEKSESSGVNEDEVGVVELDDDASPEVRDVSVTCHKCGRKTETSVTRKQFESIAAQHQDDSADAGPPQFRTKCNSCNYISTYVLTGEGTKTIA